MTRHTYVVLYLYVHVHIVVVVVVVVVVSIVLRRVWPLSSCSSCRIILLPFVARCIRQCISSLFPTVTHHAANRRIDRDDVTAGLLPSQMRELECSCFRFLIVSIVLEPNGTFKFSDISNFQRRLKVGGE